MSARHTAAILSAVAAVGLSAVIGAVAAPTAGASTCNTHSQVDVGPLSAGPAYGECDFTPGAYFNGNPGAWWLGSVVAPDGQRYSAAFHNLYNLPGVDLPLPHL